jgi:hypothetical protein
MELRLLPLVLGFLAAGWVPAASGEPVTFEFTMRVEMLDDPDGATGLAGAEEVIGTFTFDDATAGAAAPGGGTAYEAAISNVTVTFPSFDFGYDPTPAADLNRILVVNDTLIPTSGFRDTWVASAIEDEVAFLGETFALGLGDSGTDALADELLSATPPDPAAFESTDVEIRFESVAETWRVSGSVLDLAFVDVPEPAAPACTALGAALLALAGSRRRSSSD